MIGPYRIKKLIGSSYQLELLHTMKIYDVFYPNLLWKAAIDWDKQLLNYSTILQLMVKDSNICSYEVSKYKNRKRKRKKDLKDENWFWEQPRLASRY